MKYTTIIAMVILSILLASCTPVDDSSITITGSDDETTTDESVVEDETAEETVDEAEDMIKEETDDVAEDTSEEETSVEEDETTDSEETAGEDETAETGEDETFDGPQEIVIMKDISFKPKTITVETGTNILWIHNDKYGSYENLVHIIRIYPKNPSSDFKSVQSQRMLYDDRFNLTFDIPGEYYAMDIVFKDSMKGTIIVTEPAVE